MQVSTGRRLIVVAGFTVIASVVVGALAAVPAGSTSAATHAYIYWANASGTTIGRANLNGTGVTQRFIKGASPGGSCGVAVDGAQIYWAVSAGTTIGRANLDGRGVKPRFISGVRSPCGVAVDGGHIYWGQFDEGTTVGRAKLDGTGVDPNFIRGATQPCGVAVSEG